jgi:hypothetical protein
MFPVSLNPGPKEPAIILYDENGVVENILKLSNFYNMVEGLKTLIKYLFQFCRFLIEDYKLISVIKLKK